MSLKNQKTPLWTLLEAHYRQDKLQINRMIDWPEGWTDLIQRLHDDLIKINPDYRISQVKEKFAGLRFYVDPYIDETGTPLSEELIEAFHDRIREAEDESFKVCMWCGGEGKRFQPRSWMFTACDACVIENFDDKGCPIR